MRVLDRTLSISVGGGQSVQAFVRTSWQPRHGAHAVDDRAAHSIVGIGAERNSARRIEATRCIEQPFAAVAEQVVELDAASDRTTDLASHDLDQLELGIEPLEGGVR